MSQKTPESKVVTAIAKTPGLNRDAYAKATKLETPLLSRIFQKLKGESNQYGFPVIKMTGACRGATYVLTPKAHKELGAELQVERKTTTENKAKKAEPAKKETPKPKKATEKATEKAEPAKKVVKKAEPKKETPKPKKAEAPAPEAPVS